MIYFVHIKSPRTGEYYPSYNDYFRLVHLSGFAECDLEQVDPFSQNTYIFTLNYHGLDQKPIPDEYFPGKRTARMILHQLERYNIVDDRYDEIWVYDQSLMNHPKCKYVFVGGHPGFCIPRRTAQKIYDFYHMAYLYGERLKKVELVSQKFHVAPAPYDFIAKNHLLQCSKVGLCLHQDSLPLIEPIRYTVFSMYKLPLLAEYSRPNEYMTYSFSKFIEGELSFEDITEHNYDLVMEKDFKTQILNALK